ncbi:hypothetical protein AB0H42_08590 [Nocardia sp. NPDC050799]|uniref:hypothetical protein n=1 Tax=Nocardia sp. NPDC050799 TaxID=3154842 RepID=UPI003411E4DB
MPGAVGGGEIAVDQQGSAGPRSGIAGPAAADPALPATISTDTTTGNTGRAIAL